MPTLETYRKQAKLLLRWHREKNYSIGEHVRRLDRYQSLTDGEVLALSFPLTLDLHLFIQLRALHRGRNHQIPGFAHPL